MTRVSGSLILVSSDLIFFSVSSIGAVLLVVNGPDEPAVVRVGRVRVEPFQRLGRGRLGKDAGRTIFAVTAQKTKNLAAQPFWSNRLQFRPVFAPLPAVFFLDRLLSCAEPLRWEYQQESFVTGHEPRLPSVLTGSVRP
jgi:hypothetical protein